MLHKTVLVNVNWDYNNVFILYSKTPRITKDVPYIKEIFPENSKVLLVIYKCLSCKKTVSKTIYIYI